MLAVLFPLWLVSILLLATAQDGATSVLHGLTCPEVDEHITREEFCDSVEDCSNRADANTTHPDGPCVSLGPLGYLFDCGSSGDYVRLDAMCNGAIDCNNAWDETNVFCSGRTNCTDFCLNGGTCVAGGVCVCPPGWSGDRCQTAVCSVPCENGGTCYAPDSCSCGPSWTGPVCCDPLCPNECQNGGRCVFNLLREQTMCACINNWMGDMCQHKSVCYCLGGDCVGQEYDPTYDNGCNCTHGYMCIRDPACEGGDPHFLVSLPDNSNLCFSVQGEPGFAFNLVTSKTIVINAVFIKPPSRLQDWITVIGEIGVLYLTRSRSVVRMHFNFRDKSIFISGYGTLDAKRVSRVIVDGDHLDVTTSNITHSWSSNVFVSVGSELKFIVFFNYDNLDLVWSDMSNFNQSSHGILGQFFNQGTKVDTEKKFLVLPNRPPVPVTSKESHPELHHKTQCWQPTTPGYQGYKVLEGNYMEYLVNHVFATDYRYSLASKLLQ